MQRPEGACGLVSLSLLEPPAWPPHVTAGCLWSRQRGAKWPLHGAIHWLRCAPPWLYQLAVPPVTWGCLSPHPVCRPLLLQVWMPCEGIVVSWQYFVLGFVSLRQYWVIVVTVLARGLWLLGQRRKGRGTTSLVGTRGDVLYSAVSSSYLSPHLCCRVRVP